MAKRGRPPIPPDAVARYKALYIDLLKMGKTEREIDAVEDMPAWGTRYSWYSDGEFLSQCHMARKVGVEFELLEHQAKLAKVYDMALDDAANKPLVDLLKEMGSHVRWKAAKLNNDTYGDKSKVEQTGKDGGAIKQDVTFRWQNDDDSNPV